MRIGVIRNLASHAHRRRPPAPPPPGLTFAEPSTSSALKAALADFAQREIDVLVIDGGDGTVREVVTALPAAFGGATPMLALLPSGKTNLLAQDVAYGGARPSKLAEFVDQVSRAAVDERFVLRRPMEIAWTQGGHSPLRGFFFGTAAFRRATKMAEKVHQFGAFQQPAVALTLAGSAIRVLTGKTGEPWRQGEPVTLAVDYGPPRAGDRFVVLASTLERFPLRLRPFGPAAGPLRYLDVDAPPRQLPAALPKVLSGLAGSWLSRHGYRRGGAERLSLDLTEPFVLDGEEFPLGEVTLTAGAALRFVTS